MRRCFRGKGVTEVLREEILEFLVERSKPKVDVCLMCARCSRKASVDGKSEDRERMGKEVREVTPARPSVG